MKLSQRDHDKGDGLILCEWHSQGYDPLILVLFILVCLRVIQNGCFQNIFLEFLLQFHQNFVLSFMFHWIAKPTLSNIKILLQLWFSCLPYERLWSVMAGGNFCWSGMLVLKFTYCNMQGLDFELIVYTPNWSVDGFIYDLVVKNLLLSTLIFSLVIHGGLGFIISKHEVS